MPSSHLGKAVNINPSPSPSGLAAGSLGTRLNTTPPTPRVPVPRAARAAVLWPLSTTQFCSEAPHTLSFPNSR